MPVTGPRPLPDVAVDGRGLVAGRLAARRVDALPLEKLRPVIRIAHRRVGALDIPERLILDHELVLILSGRGQLRFTAPARDVIPFAAGSLLFIPPYARHDFLSDPGEGEHVAVHFDLAPNFPPFASNVQRRAPYEVRLVHGLTLPRHTRTRPGDAANRALTGIVTHFARGEPPARLRAEALLFNVLATLFDAAPDAGEPAASDATINHVARVRIDRALAWLDRHLAGRVTPVDLARAAGLSASHFNRLFRRWTGRSPGEFVLHRRVEHARKLLGDVGLSIKEVAARSGFDDPYYFSKVFRRIDGLPPTHFREALLAGRRADG